MTDPGHYYSQQLLAHFAYTLTPEARRRLMAELPAAYNAWCGRPIVHVVRSEDGVPMGWPR